jgi:16S rRNA (guanine966-N2)-methyltransferase
VEGAHVLDLFAGTGALGIEALSRGAERAVFVDSSRGATKAIEENLGRSRLAGRAMVIEADVSRFLKGEVSPKDRFDLVLCDPPYVLGSPDLEGILADVDSRWLTENPWTVVLTRGRRNHMPVVPLHWSVARRLSYGDSLVVLFREVRWA